MNYCRRLYYDKATGQMILWYCVRMTLPIQSVDQDFEVEPLLIPYQERRADVGLIEWTQPDEAIDQAFETMYRVSVDVSATPPQPVFDYDFPEEDDPGSDAAQLLNLIEGVQA